MLWLIPAMLSAMSASITDVLSKKGLKRIDEYILSWSLKFFSFAFLLPLLFFIDMPPLGGGFWPALIITGFLDSLAVILYMKAIKSSDLSLTIPMIAFTPLFLLATSPLIVGEFPNISGLAGVSLIVIGSYVLNIKEKRNGYIAPLKALLKERGPKLMLAAAFMWSITANFDKIGIRNSSPLFWSVSVELAYALILLPVMLLKSKENLRQIPGNLKALLPVGFFSAVSLVSYMVAVSLTFVAYAISVKRTGIIFGVLFGWLIFKEKGIRERLAGAALMVLGVVLIAPS